MRGTTGECLKDFFSRIPVEQCAEVLTEFVGVELKTIKRWSQGTHSPNGGEIVLRLRAFLTAMGYQLVEEEQLPAPSRMVAHLVGYGATEVETVRTQLDYTQAQGVYRLLLYGGMPQKTQAYRLERMASGAEGELEQAKLVWSDRLQSLRTKLSIAPEPKAALVPEPANSHATPAVHRLRERPKRNRERIPSEAITKALSHTMFTFDYLLREIDDKDGVAGMMGERFSAVRLQEMRSFIDKALKDK